MSPTESDAFWAEKAKEQIDFFETWTQVQAGSFEKGDIAWFLNAKLNVCYNCVDRHVKDHGDKTALIWEGNDSATDSRSVTYTELYEEVCQLSNALKSYGVRKVSNSCCLKGFMFVAREIAWPYTCLW